MAGKSKGDVQRSGQRLNGWKEITGYLGKDLGKMLSTRTTLRWRNEQGLPVYREGPAVFAYTDELDLWRSRRITDRPMETAADPVSGPERRVLPGAKTLCLVLIGAAAVILAVWTIRRQPKSSLATTPRWGRLLARATSEGNTPTQVDLQQNPDCLAVTPDGRKVYAANGWSPLLSVVATADRAVRTLLLPRDGGPLAMSPNGNRLYIGSQVGGVMILDTRTDRVNPKTIATAGPVYNMAITPDGRKLFLALGRKGVWRLNISSGDLHPLTRKNVPLYVEVDPLGERLYITYQGGEYAGHDFLEIFDIETEKVAAVVTGLPLVGGYPSPSPDEQLVMLDGLDACQNPVYDGKGCPAIPSRVVHFLRVTGHQVVRTVGFPPGQEPARFIDSGKALFLGVRISVMDTAQYMEMEKWEHAPEFFRAVAVDSTHRKAYVGVEGRKKIVFLEAESPQCTPAAEGLASFYTGDGVIEDVIGGVALQPAGDARFGPGRVGQAFVFDGKSAYLAGPRAQYYRFGYRDSSAVLYVKFASVDGEMTLVDRTSTDLAFSARLIKASDQRIVFTFRRRSGDLALLAGKSSIVPNRWYHVCVTKDDGQAALYVNGVLEDQKTLEKRAEIPGDQDIPIHLGASGDHRRFLQGKLDEILFYNRALTKDDVRHLYEMREPGGSCQI